MPLFWIAREVDGKPAVWIQDARNTNSALLHASFAGYRGGKLIDAIGLDDRRARKVPKKMQGRALSEKEVKELLERMER